MWCTWWWKAMSIAVVRHHYGVSAWKMKTKSREALWPAVHRVRRFYWLYCSVPCSDVVRNHIATGTRGVNGRNKSQQHSDGKPISEKTDASFYIVLTLLLLEVFSLYSFLLFSWMVLQKKFLYLPLGIHTDVAAKEYREECQILMEVSGCKGRTLAIRNSLFM